MTVSVGAAVPDFSLKDQSMKDVSLLICTTGNFVDLSRALVAIVSWPKNLCNFAYN